MRSEVQKLPKVFLDRLRLILPQSKWDAIANTFAEPKPTTFRVNTLKTEASFVRETLEHSGFRIEAVSWYSDAFVLKEGRLRELQETEIYKKGEIYVQNLSSMIPPLILNPESSDLVLDLTAAPGSKTTQMSCLMRGHGKIVANDNNKVRFYKLKANLDLQGATNVEAMLRYGEAFGRDYPETFDKVLLDAPCSAEGRFDLREPGSFGYWKPAKVFEMARKQKKLLSSALGALKSGGDLVYSTCTFAPEENEGVLNWALEKFGDSIKIEKISFLLPNQMGGLLSWEEETFHPSVRNCVRILPTDRMEGFFVTRLSKIKSTKSDSSGFSGPF